MIRSRTRTSFIAALIIGICLSTATLGYLFFAAESLNHRLTAFRAETGHTFLPSDLFVPWFGARWLLQGGDP